MGNHPEQADEKQHLHQEDRRNAYREPGLVGLVMKTQHPSQDADAAPQQGHEHQGRLRDAPPALPGPALVGAHEQEGGDIHRLQINKSDQ